MIERAGTDAAEARFAPLEGVRVLDLTRVLAGPYATMLLGDLGADVVKVERPMVGDETRSVVTYPGRASHDEDYFYVANRNKRSIALDLKDEAGLATARELATVADVVVENFRPGVVQRLGLDVGSVRETNPKVIYCSVSGFGQTGPRRVRPSYDGIIQAMSGLMSLTGDPDGPPTRAGIMIADLSGGLLAVVAIMAALEERRRTGRGSHIDVALLESLVGMLGVHAAEYLATGRVPGRTGSSNPNRAPAGAFRTADGRYVQLMASTDHLWEALCAALEAGWLTADPRFATQQDRLTNRGALDAALQEIFLSMDADEVTGRLDRAGVPCAPVLDVGQALTQEQVVVRGLVREVDHPMSGGIRQIGFPALFDGKRPEVDRPPPVLDQDRADVVRDWLGEP